MKLINYAVRWALLTIPMAAAVGSIVALFLFLLAAATQFRFSHPWLLFLLPLAGVLIHFIYRSLGKSSEKGNNLIIDRIHQGGGGIPGRMAPIILMTTIITHLFGGSAGREGTAVQIGGSIASVLGGIFKASQTELRILLTAGIAAGFGAVFGTPFAGAVFALEVLTVGRIRYDAFLPALVSAVVADLTVSAWHVVHVHYRIDSFPVSSELFAGKILMPAKVVVASAAFGLVSYLFVKLAHGIGHISLKLFTHRWLIPVAGGSLVIGLTLLLGKPDYLGLGVDPEYKGAVTILSAFREGGSDTWSWLWKMIYTAITLGTGFKGGEVTPLFYIGATLGNTLAEMFHAPAGLFAALGFIAVFAGATNTPLACALMGVELFGGQHVLLFGIACFTAYLFSGRGGIYSAQRLAGMGVSKRPAGHGQPVTAASKARGYLHQKLGKYSLPSFFTQKNNS